MGTASRFQRVYKGEALCLADQLQRLAPPQKADEKQQSDGKTAEVAEVSAVLPPKREVVGNAKFNLFRGMGTPEKFRAGKVVRIPGLNKAR